ncbi:hypothetical protein BJX63DRAFT_219002 [Aspergillus granulosus]|uniref:Uncharacterized protein n=1 Tax=Aspergillus granulosus TaxID=176169 RepID=A0ABR4I1D1_9EURO
MCVGENGACGRSQVSSACHNAASHRRDGFQSPGRIIAERLELPGRLRRGRKVEGARGDEIDLEGSQGEPMGGTRSLGRTKGLPSRFRCVSRLQLSATQAGVHRLLWSGLLVARFPCSPKNLAPSSNPTAGRRTEAVTDCHSAWQTQASQSGPGTQDQQPNLSSDRGLALSEWRPAPRAPRPSQITAVFQIPKIKSNPNQSGIAAARKGGLSSVSFHISSMTKMISKLLHAIIYHSGGPFIPRALHPSFLDSDNTSSLQP